MCVFVSVCVRVPAARACLLTSTRALKEHIAVESPPLEPFILSYFISYSQTNNRRSYHYMTIGIHNQRIISIHSNRFCCSY